MTEKRKTIDELKHMVRYYGQAVNEFFDDTSSELRERVQTFHDCLEKGENSLDEYRKMIDLLLQQEERLKKRVQDLRYLSNRMNQLF